jgi:hypothetical protein
MQKLVPKDLAFAVIVACIHSDTLQYELIKKCVYDENFLGKLNSLENSI